MAQPSASASWLDGLSPDEKPDYIQALWDHFAEPPEEVPVRHWHHLVIAEWLADTGTAG